MKKIILFSDYDGDKDLEDLSYEETLFKEELEVYKDNLIKILLDIICKEIDKLPETQKAVLYPFYFEGKTFKEIGEQLNLSENTVAHRKKRAILTLRRLLLENPYAVSLYEKIKKLDPTIKNLLEIADFLDKTRQVM